MALYEMVQNVMPNRPTDTPGVTAWLHLELQQYLSGKRHFSQIDDGFFADRQAALMMPAAIEPLSKLLTYSPIDAIEKLPDLAIHDLPMAEGEMENPYFRKQYFLTYGEAMFVNTTRSGTVTTDVQDLQNPSHRFLHATLPILIAIKQRLKEDPQWKLASDRFRPVRLYALCENNMLTTLPLSMGDSNAEEEPDIFLHEGRELSKSPKLPNFVSNEFFFIFDFNDTEASQPFFSGLYLDVGGQGLVATLTAPLHTPEGELKGVLGLDLRFDLDWHDFAQNLRPPLKAELVPMLTAASQIGSHPWQALLESGPHKNSSVQAALTHLARSEKKERRFHNPSPIYHSHVPDLGAAVAFQANPDHWLVVIFPQFQSQFPTLSIVFLSILFLVLLAGFEWNRRLAQREGRKAVREFEEKQNLLDTMRVPLMVVDPNTEEIVYGNRASKQLGIQPGKSFKSLLERNPAAKAHYERMQTVVEKDYRAYGLPICVQGKTEYAIIRSVAVRAPIGMIRANERHRLGILFLIDPDADLTLFTKALSDRTRSEERTKLASLLEHGVNTLARVHAHCQAKGSDTQFLIWLSDYIHRRIRLTSWVLNHWDTDPPLPQDCLISASHGRSTVARLTYIFGIVARDADLRLQLHWHNGALAGLLEADNGDEDYQTIETHIQWPENVCVTCPVAGGFGFFLSEIMVNAIRHGKPGQRPKLEIKYNLRRKELVFHMSNGIQQDSTGYQAKAYGGLAILNRLVKLFGWHPLDLKETEATFTTTWRVPASEIDPCQKID